VCGEELLTEAQRQAATEAIEARVAEILGDVAAWQPLGFVPEAFKAPPVFTASYDLGCRICSSAGWSSCPAHGPFRPVPDSLPFRSIGGC
jgi:hypothetical protein